MHTVVIKPKNPIIKRYIQYFLFISNKDENYVKSHICFPNTNHCLGLTKGYAYRVRGLNKYIYERQDGYSSYLTGIYERPIDINANGCFEEVCIDFEPLGLEMITGIQLSSFKFKNEVVENMLPKFWSGIYDAAFATEEVHTRATLLEEFLLNCLPVENPYHFVPLNNLNTKNVAHLESNLYMSYRSIHRHFARFLDVTPKKFMNIARLRRGIQSICSSEAFSQIAYDNGFADQSHMIREFRKYTGLSPKKFMEESSVVDDNVWWYIR